MSTTRRFGVAALVIVLLAAACSGSQPTAAGTDPTPAQIPEPTAQSAPTTAPSPAASPEPPATSEPTSTAEPVETPVPSTAPEPTATAEPTSTPTPPAPTPTPVDVTPVVIEGEGWVITEADVARLAAFVEDTHELEYTSPVTVLVSNDVGREYAPNFEPFSTEEWWLLQALGLADSQVDRDVTNQVRRDRIRGLCCRFNQGTQVVVEIEVTKLETEAIIVHELTHALHTQYPRLFQRTRFETDESPRPFSASIEGVPQFVTFAYLALASAEELALVTPELPIIRPDMVPLIGPGPAQHLNFAYATGPAFVDAIVAARGIDGLSDLLIEPARTTEQILFPDKYLAGEGAESVADPEAPVGADVVATGTIGSAMFLFSLVDAHGETAALELVEPWAGDRFVIYQVDGNACMVANIKLDSAEAQSDFGEALLAGLRPDFPDATILAIGDIVELRTCSAS